MSRKRWIQRNLDADRTLVWIVANAAKFGIELGITSVVMVPFFLVVYGTVLATEGAFPFGAAGPVGLYLLLVAGAYKEFWNCRLSQ